MEYKQNWDETKERFKMWWDHSKMDRPLMRIVARREKPVEALEPVAEAKTPKEKYLDVDFRVKSLRNYCREYAYMGDAFPSVDINIGTGSMSTYLGCEPVFSWDTVWFKECIEDGWQDYGDINYDSNNSWLQLHINSLKKAVEMSGDEFMVNIPDIIENLDILMLMRGSQNLCFDLMDEPELIKKYISQIDDLYFKYYDELYDIIKGNDGSSSYTTFNIWGPGRIAKIQCDFSAMISPEQYREFALPSLRKQCKRLDYSMYHLDGPYAIKHMDALMEIEELDALQWSPGAGQPDGGSEEWYKIYDKARNAGKSLWINIKDGNADGWIYKADMIVKRYGPSGIYFLFPEMEMADAERILLKAEKEWK